MGKGVLLEVNGRHGMVLTPEGEFRRVRLAAPAEVGEEVSFPDAAPAGGARWWWLAAAAAVILAVALPLSVNRWLIGPAVAVVAVDINPSAEFDIDAHSRVVAARARNDDGQSLLQELGQVRGRRVDEVVAQLTDRAIARGYLKAQDAEAAVLVTVAPAPGAAGLAGPAEQELEQQVQAAARSVVETKYGGAAQVHAVGATAQDKEQADRLGVPLGRYLQYEAARALNPQLELTPEQIRNLKLSQLKQLLRREDAEEILERVHEQQQRKGKGPGAGQPEAKGQGKGKPEGRGRPSGNRGSEGRKGLPGLSVTVPTTGDVDLSNLLPRPLGERSGPPGDGGARAPAVAPRPDRDKGDGRGNHRGRDDDQDTGDDARKGTGRRPGEDRDKGQERDKDKDGEEDKGEDKDDKGGRHDDRESGKGNRERPVQGAGEGNGEPSGRQGRRP